MVVTLFSDAEARYLAWLAANPTGWVVNTTRRPDPEYLVLHRATCASISTAHANYTTHGYMKVCAQTRADLEAWGRDHVRGQVTCTCHCLGCDAPTSRG